MKKFFDYTDRIVPPHHPRAVVETAVQQGASREAVLQGTGVTSARLETPDARLSYVEYGLVIRNAIGLTGNSGLGLDVGTNLGFAQMGILGLAMMSSGTIGAALELFMRHGRTLAPSHDLEMRRGPGVARLLVRGAISFGPFETFAHEMLLAAIDAQGRALLGKPLPIVRGRLSYPRPPHAHRYEDRHPGIPIHFDSGETAFDFDPAVLETPIPLADPATARLAEELHVGRMSDARERNGLLSQVRRVLTDASGAVDEEQVARAMQTSVRSLQRALRGMGTTFQTLRDESRRRLAEEWMESTEMTVAEIAERLDFGDVRSFRRAFKRWTGAAPQEYRARYRLEQNASRVPLPRETAA